MYRLENIIRGHLYSMQYLNRDGINRDYKNQHQYNSQYQPSSQHSFNPSIFLNPIGQTTTTKNNSPDEIKNIAKEIFELMTGTAFPEDISITILPLEDFRIIHLVFGRWSDGILGFSINSKEDKKIFVRESSLDSLLIVIGHEIGHVLTEPLSNRHDEEAKAFAFTFEWAKTIKKHNIANLGEDIKDEFEFNPARNGLHDVAFGFVDFMRRKGKNAVELHRDLVNGYVSVFGAGYF